ncbi:3'(2'),5'-bisphosphate nucleotidase CysQ [Sphingomicrobium astaxanthinifaciens]|uniref:3'(2'),5'-bisphosphate nucleotidase CysQ n=1 Tax=Sphingomicrobium astaxanthinifaciens TaxID=1227949 RepID=UPI001FCBD495|nr:3'(2'),5'-bisphosphate nucleotidase CysQ [Sphingomicrobium astaxanthinifaciens]MCJ7421916.1 3'(2'),5'-bisphosphate nucleotidase CysQ [Sphingomicrobium astaxanthinifaciens]
MTLATPQLLDALGETAREAGEAILAIVRQGFDVERKSDASPVTVADRAAEAVILEALRMQAPGVPVIAEEEVAAGRIPAHDDTFFLVDPLDGTREFIRGGEDYTVNIGLVEDGQPILGVVYSPASRHLHLGLAGRGAWLEAGGPRRAIRCRELGEERVAVASKSHLTQATVDYLEQAFGGHRPARISVGSSLKFCILAEGHADVYPRLSPTSEWDTAAGHAVLLGAGGRVDGPDGETLGYGKPAFFNPGFVATAGWKAPAIGPYMPIDVG